MDTVMVMVTEEAIGAILDIAGATLVDIGVADGAILDTTDRITDTTIILTVTEEEVLQLIMAAETTGLTETITLTETIAQTEIVTTTQTEIILLQTEGAIIPQTDKMVFLILEEALLQAEEHTTRLTQLLQTEEDQVRVKAIVTTILTEDQAALQPEVTTAVATPPEATLLAHHAQ